MGNLFQCMQGGAAVNIAPKTLVLSTNPVIGLAPNDVNIVASWEEPDTEIDIEKYNVYFSLTKPNKISDMTYVGSTTETSYDITELATDTLYYIGVQSVSIEGYENGSMWQVKSTTTLPDKAPGLYSSDGTRLAMLTTTLVGTDYTSSNTLADSLSVDKADVAEMVVPKSSTSIGKYAAYNNVNMTSVTLPDTITSIKDDAFNSCTSLSSIEFPNSITSIGARGFANCMALTSVEIPNTVTSIGSGIFYHCTGITSVSIGTGLTSIPSYSFEDCFGLTSVEIPSNITSIGQYAFYKCTNLASVKYKGVIYTYKDTLINALTDNGVTIGTSAFDDTKLKVPGLYASNGSLISTLSVGQVETDYTDDMNLVSTLGLSLTDATKAILPENATKLGKSLFANCLYLESITIPARVTSIGYHAFCKDGIMSAEDSLLSSVTFENPYNWYVGNTADDITTAIDSDLLSNPSTAARCLKSDYVNKYWASDGAPGLYSNDGALLATLSAEQVEADYEMLSTILYSSNFVENTSTIGKIVIPANATKIGDYAFYPAVSNFPNLKEVIIPNGISSIGKNNFYGCTGLTSVIIPDSVTSIGDLVLGNCTNLTSLTLSNNLESIGENAFTSCTKLTTLTLPSSITSIDMGAFDDCYNLIPIMYNNVEYISRINLINALTTNGVADNSAFQRTGLVLFNDGRIYNSMDGRLKLIKVSDLAATYTSDSNLPTYYSIAISKVNKVGIDSTSTSIGDYAFYGCNALKTVNIEEGLTSIGAYAFAGCTELQYISIPSTVKTIDANAFTGCTNLMRVYFKDPASWYSRTEDGLWADLIDSSLLSNPSAAAQQVKANASNGLMKITFSGNTYT